MNRAIVTGGTGFVGANIARRLLREGHEVHLLVRPGFSAWRIEEIRRDVQIHEIDFLDAKATSRVVAGIHPDWIFHLAAHGAYSWQNDVRQIFDTNLRATINLLEASLENGFAAFVHTGSSSEYGFKDHAPSENEGIDPNSHYACAKAAASLYCRQTARARDAHVVTMRLYSAFGPFEEPDRFLPKLIECGLRGTYPPLVKPDTARDFIYVEDVCDACLLAAETPRARGAIYNLGTGTQVTISEAVETARKVLGISAEPQWASMPDRVWDTTCWVADNRKIKTELGWQPRYNFEQGFRAMLENSRTFLNRPAKHIL